MSGYRQGHDQGHDPYIDYAAQSDAPTEERVFGTHQDIQHSGQHSGTQGLELHQHLGPHQQQPQHPHQQHHSQHQVYDPHPMAHHHPPPFGGGQQGQMIYRQQIPQPSGTKRPRPDSLELEMGMQEQQMHPGDMTGLPSQMSQQSMGGYTPQPIQQTPGYHTHTLPGGSHRAQKLPRTELDELSPGGLGGAPSVVGMEGMPEPAQRPRGPKLKFTPEDDAKLVDLKENKSLTWKQIAEFFPGRSSGTLQVRYCTKLKAKTTQWTDETVQKLRTALHDYEQEKWRIIAQKVGTGFTSAACKEKAREL